MEKNKKIEIFLGFLILLTIIGIVYNEYIEHLNREGFVPFVIFWDNLMFFVRTVPFVVMCLMILLAFFTTSKIISGFIGGLSFIATAEMD